MKMLQPIVITLVGLEHFFHTFLTAIYYALSKLKNDVLVKENNVNLKEIILNQIT